MGGSMRWCLPGLSPYLERMHEYDAGRRIRSHFMQDEWRPGLFYHVIGKAVPGRRLFTSETDMRWFLKRVLRFKLYHALDILAYCLCGNHFHLCVQTRMPEAILASLAGKPRAAWSASDSAFAQDELAYPEFVYNTLSGALSGFARYANNLAGREGQLFIKPTLHGLTTKGAPGVRFSRRMYCYVSFNYAKHHLGTPDAPYFASSLSNPLYQIIDHGRVLELFGGSTAYAEYCNRYLRRYGPAFYNFDEDELFAALRPRRLNPLTGQWEEGEWRPED